MTDLALAGVNVHRGGIAVVRDVSLLVAKGRWFGLIGANGSGKTSLLRAVAGRLPIAGGACRIDGVDHANDRHARARVVGFAPSIEMLPGSLSGAELLRLVAGDLDRAFVALGPVGEALGLKPLLGRTIAFYSSGMRQRLTIACALAAGQRLVVLDEPFNWLDPVAAYDVRMALREMVDGGLTLFTALHDLNTLAAVCDEGALLAGAGVALSFTSPMMQAARTDLARFEHETIGMLREAGGTPRRLPEPSMPSVDLKFPWRKRVR